MPEKPLFDIATVMDRLLKDVVPLRRERTPADFAGALPEFASLPRYVGLHGADLLYKEIKEAIAALPEDPKLEVQDSTWGLTILGFTDPRVPIGRRRTDLKEGNGSARKFRDRCVVQAALHHVELRALDFQTPLRGLYDSGFDVVKISVGLSTSGGSPLTLRHTVHMRLRARRSGLRFIPLCYSGCHNFHSVVAHSTKAAPVDMTYAGCTVTPTGNQELPLHLFWLSQAPLPYTKIYMKAVFYEQRESVWTEARSRLLLINDENPEVVMRATYSEWFDRVRGYRIAPDSIAARPEFDSGPPERPERLLEYRPRHTAPLTEFQLRVIASERHLDKQRRYMR
jgi:hypothetical protein